MSQLLLSAQNLCLTHRHKQVLDNINIQLNAGQITTLIGPNGCGKSTLVKVLLGLTQPDSGQIERQPNLRIGYMPQYLRLDPLMPLTVDGFLRLTKGASESALTEWLQRLDITSLRHQSVHHLSGGEWQRVLLVRALLRNPQLLVLDEPVQGVDVQGQQELYQLIPTLRDEFNCAVLMVSHDLHLVMAATDEVICLNGHVCCSGSPQDVSLDPAYISLFGRSPIVVPYTHHHDHHHGLDGHIEPSQCSHSSQEPS